MDLTDGSLQLSDTNLYLGLKLESFLAEVGLTRSSPELAPWLGKVREFYSAALSKAQKYFRAPLSSKVLRACEIFDPEILFSSPLDEVKSNFKTVASRFSNVIKKEQVPSW